jgi:hypothetical protein
LNYRGWGVTVDAVSKASGAQAGFATLNADQLIRAAGTFGLPLAHGVNQTLTVVQSDLAIKQPVMALVNYAALPNQLKRDQGYTRGHWILIVGCDGANVIWHDPYELDAAHGAYKMMTVAEFDHAWSTINADFSIPRQVLRVNVAPPPPDTLKALTGLHDIGGLEYMVTHAIKGVGLALVTVQHQAAVLDFTRYANAGIDVIVRIGWGYADGSGTLPKTADLPVFEQAVIATMLNAKGVKAWQYGNEINNAGEWPAGFALTPEYYIASYNRIWSAVKSLFNMGPSAIDPYFGPGSNNRDWWTKVLAGITGAAALFLHPKTQSNDPAEVYSAAKFGDDPLKWQFLNFRTIETSLEVVPARFKALPVYLSEVNPQRVAYPMTFGWKADNAAWVSEARRYVAEWNAGAAHQPITGIIFYRWADDDWALNNKPALLAAMFK